MPARRLSRKLDRRLRNIGIRKTKHKRTKRAGIAIASGTYGCVFMMCNDVTRRDYESFLYLCKFCK